MEKMLFERLDENIDNSKNENGYLWYPRSDIKIVVFNVIYDAIFGEYINFNDKKYDDYNNALTKYVNSMQGACFSQLFPKLMAIILGFAFARQIFNKEFVIIRNLMKPDILKSKKKLEEKYEKYYKTESERNIFLQNHCETVFDWMYFVTVLEKKQLQQESNKDNNNTIHQRLINDLFLLLHAGTETTGAHIHV